MFVRTVVSSRSAVRALAELMNRVGFGGERIVICRHRKPLCALVPIRDLDAIEETTARARPSRAAASEKTK